MREGGRRPYIIHDYMYSTSILKSDLADVQKKGVLNSARWVKNRQITSENRMAAGAELSKLLCLPCHSTGGPLNDILPIARRFSPAGMETFILGMGGDANPYMPPFAGTTEEAAVLAQYLTTVLTPGFMPDPPYISPVSVSPAPFDVKSSEYVLLAGPTLGTILNSTPDISGIDLSYGAPTLRAQLIFRDPSPAVILDDAVINYTIKTGDSLLGGQMLPQDGYFEAVLDEIPSLNTPFQPFLIANIEAQIQGRTVATTRARIGISTELGCRNCHGGNWEQEGRSGLSKETAAGILRSHDTRSNTRLSEAFKRGTTIVCASCHNDSSRNIQGKPELLSLSASIHGFHGVILAETAECSLCHASGDNSASHSFDGMHKQLELSCSNCHGTLADHSAALLKHEEETGQAKQLLASLADKTETALPDILPRAAWNMEPDCLTCHIDFQPPETDTAFNTWTEDEAGLFHNRMGEGGAVLCASCHGQPHSLYPATNAYGKSIGALQPLQYQNTPYPIAADKGCVVCHTMEMEDEMHHPGSLGIFRNKEE